MQTMRMFHTLSDRAAVANQLRKGGRPELADRLEALEGDTIALDFEDAQDLRLAEVLVAWAKPVGLLFVVDEPHGGGEG